MGNNECNMDYKITYSEAIERLKYMKIKAEVALSTTKCTCSWAKESVNGTIMALDMAINALEKQIPKKPKHVLIKYGKHTWKKNEDGEVDDFAWDYDYHNGVVCEVCGKTVCVHCNPKYDELTDCEKEYWECQSCGKKLYSNRKYCDCGQKLKWESDEE